MIIDVKTNAVKATFQTYVKPTIDPVLTPFCTELTGITQEHVDGGVDITVALQNAHEFLRSEGLFSSEFIFMSCGDFDGRTVSKEAKKKDLQIPSYLRRWINLKKAFPMNKYDQSKPALDFSTP